MEGAPEVFVRLRGKIPSTPPWISRRFLHLQAWISRNLRLLPDEFITYTDE